MNRTARAACDATVGRNKIVADGTVGL